MYGTLAFPMSRKLLEKKGILLLVLVSLSIGMVGCNKSKVDTDTSIQSEIQNDETIEDAIDNDYEMPDDVDLNEEFENRVESEKNNSSNSTNSTNTSDSNSVVDEEKSDKEDSQSSNDNTLDVTEKTGLFQGFADDNSVEVQIGSEYATYRVSSTAKSSLSNKNIGDSIVFGLKSENGQLVISFVK